MVTFWWEFLLASADCRHDKIAVMNEPLLLPPAPREIEELLLWAEGYQSDLTADEIDYDNAADIITELNCYLAQVEAEERRRAFNEAIAGMHQAMQGFCQSLLEAFAPVAKAMQEMAERFFEAIEPYFAAHQAHKEREARRRVLFMTAGQHEEIVRRWQRNQTALRVQARHHVRPLRRTGVRQIIRR